MDSKKESDVTTFAGMFFSTFGVNVTLEQVRKSHHDCLKEIGEPDEPFEAKDVYEAFCDCYMIGKTEDYRELFESVRKTMSESFIHNPKNRFIKQLIDASIK